MKKTLIFLLFVIFLFLTPTRKAHSGSRASHTVTVKVESINEIHVNKDYIILTKDSASLGNESDYFKNDSNCNLKWRSNQSYKKITVVTEMPPEVSTLKVIPHHISGGRTVSKTCHGKTASDFVTDIKATNGTCNLQYTANIHPTAKSDQDPHEVTYTFTDL